MFDVAIGNFAQESGEELFSSDFQIEVEKIVFLNWEEHCVECSPPFCYHNCKNYVPRIDGRCIRMQNGIQRVRGINGFRGYGIKCEFRKWAKLESLFSGRLITLEEDIKYDKVNNYASSLVLDKYSYKFVDGCRRHLFKKTFSSVSINVDYFYINCYLQNKEEVQFLVQIDTEEKILFTHIYTLRKGENTLRVPISETIPVGARVFVTPLEETNTIIYFRWLDFVKLAELQPVYSYEKVADKVKVVVWDLDNTLWKGTLINDTHVELNQNALDTIIELDKRGILNTICSKNDELPALDKLREFGIADYFLYPAINWGQKSENIKTIAQQLNLGINSFAFIDDNIREREEVRQSLPMIRIYSDKDIVQILSQDAFKVPITKTSQNRRFLYMEDMKRNSLKESFSHNYDDFLRSLEMELFVDSVNDKNRGRCYELLSRSNQLNLSTNRYTQEEFENLLSGPDNLCLTFRVSDKFGDYGVVAFMSLKMQGSVAHICDLVISCRIAKKKVENAIIRSLKKILLERGVKSLIANLIITKKNSPLVCVFEELPFNIISQDSEHIQYELKDISVIVEDDIIEINNL